MAGMQQQQPVFDSDAALGVVCQTPPGEVALSSAAIHDHDIILDVHPGALGTVPDSKNEIAVLEPRSLLMGSVKDRHKTPSKRLNSEGLRDDSVASIEKMTISQFMKARDERNQRDASDFVSHRVALLAVFISMAFAAFPAAIGSAVVSASFGYTAYDSMAHLLSHAVTVLGDPLSPLDEYTYTLPGDMCQPPDAPSNTTSSDRCVFVALREWHFGSNYVTEDQPPPDPGRQSTLGLTFRLLASAVLSLLILPSITIPLYAKSRGRTLHSNAPAQGSGGLASFGRALYSFRELILYVVVPYALFACAYDVVQVVGYIEEPSVAYLPIEVFIAGQWLIYGTYMAHYIYFLHAKYKLGYVGFGVVGPTCSFYFFGMFVAFVAGPTLRHLDSDGKRTLFRLLGWPIITEVFIAIPRVIIRKVPESVAKRDLAIMAVTPFLILGSFYGRFLLASLRSAEWIVGANIGLMLAELGMRLSLGRRDRFFVRLLSARKLDSEAWRDLFGANWAVHYRCMMVCVDLVMEYVNIVGAMLLVYTMNIVSSVQDGAVTLEEAALNVAVQLVLEGVTDVVCLYFETQKMSLPIFRVWNGRNQTFKWFLALQAVAVVGYATLEVQALLCPTIDPRGERVYSLVC